MAYIDTKTFKPHAEISVPEVEARSFECDDLIAPVISLLNQKGYKTNFCCAGHPYPNYEEMYLFVYEDTKEAISSTHEIFEIDDEFLKSAVVFEMVCPQDIPEEHQFDDITIDTERPYSFYYVETDNSFFGSIAYISFKENYFDEDSIPFGWDLYDSEVYDPEAGECVVDKTNSIIDYHFPHDQDVYYFFAQQVAVFMSLYNWAKELPDISEKE
jgi:hypothetical protein